MIFCENDDQFLREKFYNLAPNSPPNPTPTYFSLNLGPSLKQVISSGPRNNTGTPPPHPKDGPVDDGILCFY